MKNRLETLRSYVDTTLGHIPDAFRQRCAYLHLYGVSQACALIASRRGLDAELAAMAGMLHDIYACTYNDGNGHAEKGAPLARRILGELGITDEAETALICGAIASHSDKTGAHDAFTEVLIDADVMQHVLYNPNAPVMSHERARWERLAGEFGLAHQREGGI